MINWLISLVRRAWLLPMFAILAVVFLPLESSALIPRDLPDATPFLVTDWVICRNDPINNVDPLGLWSWDNYYIEPFFMKACNRVPIRWFG